MRIHHLNAISICPLGGRLMDGMPTCRPTRSRARAPRCAARQTETGNYRASDSSPVGNQPVTWSRRNSSMSGAVAPANWR